MSKLNCFIKNGINYENNKQMSKKKIYVSGKITGLDINEATKMFKDAAGFVEKVMEEEAVNPMGLVEQNDDWLWIDYMRVDIEALIYCDGIIMLPNWKESDGAKVEHELAKGLKLKIYYL